jgi:hypothetical protein
MKTLFDKATRDELIIRINMLNENSTAQWGKMNIRQMLRHCTLFDEMLLGKRTFKRIFIGRLFGKIALRDLIKDDNPVRHDMPTLPELRVKDSTGTVGVERQKWVTLIKEYADFSKPYTVHAFMGKMTQEQMGRLAYKHIDHHLRQFNS